MGPDFPTRFHMDLFLHLSHPIALIGCCSFLSLRRSEHMYAILHARTQNNSDILVRTASSKYLSRRTEGKWRAFQDLDATPNCWELIQPYQNV